ncbi:MAG TPA: efflux RND transporter periplasmic adaptor subunit [Steroidobacteraceae bacterium]|nr:efflux RND transporter periplasmic adaptor subunit [Steroidobacteraceae bacterium]
MSMGKTKAVPKTTRRWRLLGGLLAVLATVGAVYGTYWAQVLRYRQSTDDAYVGGNVVQITPQISGTVVAVGADDTQFVKAGQPLVRLDPADAHVALDQAEAQLARTVRDVRNLYATSSQLAATVQMRETELAAARSDLARRQQLVVTGAISGEELQHAVDAVKTAQAQLIAAGQQLAGNRARVDGTTLEDHPQVRDAAAAVRNAYLTLDRTELTAPVAGFVARRNVQLGQRVSPGAPLMAVVPLDQVWVDANFKEPQLAHMRIGQPVRVTADLYGGHVVYHGTVAGFGAGTGAAFSLLPAQNATGNWIKIVQRVPVRIALDPREIAAHPLQIGLSMKAEVDVKGGDNGARLPAVASNQPTWTSTALDTSEREAYARVQAIISANQSTPGTAPTARTSPAIVPAGRLAVNLPLPGAARRSH